MAEDNGEDGESPGKRVAIRQTGDAVTPPGRRGRE